MSRLRDTTPRLSIRPGSRSWNRSLMTNHPFFEPHEEYIIKTDGNKIIFTRPTLDYRGTTHRASHGNIFSQWITLFFDNDTLPIVKELSFDPEETNEDQAVVYLS